MAVSSIDLRKLGTPRVMGNNGGVLGSYAGQAPKG
jgi:hypothetical protein